MAEQSIRLIALNEDAAEIIETLERLTKRSSSELVNDIVSQYWHLISDLIRVSEQSLEKLHAGS